MRIIGCDLHARQQTVAMLDTATGEVVKMTVTHEGNNVREFYSKLPRPAPSDRQWPGKLPANAQADKSPSPRNFRLSLVAVRMIVAPLPVVPLVSGALLVVLAISLVLFRVVTPVSAILAVVPIMIIAMIAIIDPDLDAALLGTRRSQDRRWRNDGRCQQY
jgi:hypothetical protein